MNEHDKNLSGYTGFNVHDQYKNLTVPELQEVSSRSRLDIGVLCLNVEKDLNISNIVRSSHCLGVRDVFILGNSKFDSRGCVGSQNYTNIVKQRMDVKSIKTYIVDEIIGNMGYDVVFVDKTSTSKSISSFSFWRASKRKVCLVMGNERAGIPDSIMDLGYNCYHIPQRGVIRSMNVSSAASIVIYECVRNKSRILPWIG